MTAPPASDAPIGMILAAGRGSRMRPLTDVVPKPLLPFLNTPIIAYALDHLVKAGVRKIGVNLHHLPDAIPQVLDRIALAYRFQGTPIELTYVREETLRGTAGGVAGIWEAMGRPQATAIVLNGDPVMNLDLAEALAHHRAKEARATLLVRPRSDDHPGRVFTGADGKLTGLRDLRTGGADDPEREFMGVHILSPSALDAVSERTLWRDDLSCMVGDVYMPLLSDGASDLYTHLIDDFWVALDTPKLLLDTTRRVLDQPSLFRQAPFQADNPHKLWVSTPDAVHRKTLFAPPVFLGLYASCEAGARVGSHVVLDGCAVTTGAHVERAVLFGMGRIEGQWSGCVAVNGKVVQVE